MRKVSNVIASTLVLAKASLTKMALVEKRTAPVNAMANPFKVI
jgi:hypothetical protein